MTVKELKEEIKNLNDTDLVVMSKDSEGNGFSPLSEISLQMYLPADREIGERELTKDLEKQGYTSEDIATEEEGAVKCITLWPVT